MITPQQTLERAYAALSAAAFAHPSAADEIGTQCSEAAKELRALLATQAQGQDAAPAEFVKFICVDCTGCEKCRPAARAKE